jgi:L-asparaginase II
VTVAGDRAELVAEVTRRDVATGTDVVESTHRGHVVVVGPGGEVVAGLGDPDRLTFVRSAVKAFQATACLEILDEHGGADALTPADIAIGQASHGGEPRHLQAVHDLLARSGTADEDVTTPPGRSPARPELGEARIHYNCSGKHALFALAGQAIGCPRDRLLAPEGALQRRVLGVLEEALGPITTVGTDGCGAPAVGVPLVRLADAFRRLRREDRWARARDAALAEPELVGGRGLLDTALLTVGVSAKRGAEGVHGAAWDDAEGRSWGIAVKCEDGAERGADLALAGVLEAAGVIHADVWQPAPPLGGGAPAGTLRTAAPVRTLGRRLHR